MVHSKRTGVGKEWAWQLRATVYFSLVENVLIVLCSVNTLQA